MFGIIKALKKRQERKDAEYFAEMQEEVKTMCDADLRKINMDFHHGIAMDKKMGQKVRPILLKVDRLIEEEMNNRGLRSCDDLEEEVFFAQRGAM